MSNDRDEGHFSDFSQNKCSLFFHCLIESRGDVMEDDIADEPEWRTEQVSLSVRQKCSIYTVFQKN